jgi:uncharacterized membrane protein
MRDKAIHFKLIVHLVGCFIEYLKMHGTTNPKRKLIFFMRQTTLAQKHAHILCSYRLFATMMQWDNKVLNKMH